MDSQTLFDASSAVRALREIAEQYMPANLQRAAFISKFAGTLLVVGTVLCIVLTKNIGMVNIDGKPFPVLAVLEVVAAIFVFIYLDGKGWLIPGEALECEISVEAYQAIGRLRLQGDSLILVQKLVGTSLDTPWQLSWRSLLKEAPLTEARIRNSRAFKVYQDERELARKEMHAKLVSSSESKSS